MRRLFLLLLSAPNAKQIVSKIPIPSAEVDWPQLENSGNVGSCCFFFFACVVIKSESASNVDFWPPATLFIASETTEAVGAFFFFFLLFFPNANGSSSPSLSAVLVSLPPAKADPTFSGKSKFGTSKTNSLSPRPSLLNTNSIAFPAFPPYAFSNVSSSTSLPYLFLLLLTNSSSNFSSAIFSIFPTTRSINVKALPSSSPLKASAHVEYNP